MRQVWGRHRGLTQSGRRAGDENGREAIGKRPSSALCFAGNESRNWLQVEYQGTKRYAECCVLTHGNHSDFLGLHLGGILFGIHASCGAPCPVLQPANDVRIQDWFKAEARGRVSERQVGVSALQRHPSVFVPDCLALASGAMRMDALLSAIDLSATGSQSPCGASRVDSSVMSEVTVFCRGG